jgi:hypothetical protein
LCHGHGWNQCSSCHLPDGSANGFWVGDQKCTSCEPGYLADDTGTGTTTGTTTRCNPPLPGHYKRITLDGVTYQKINQWAGDTETKNTAALSENSLTATQGEGVSTSAKLSDDEINTLRNTAEKRGSKNIYMIRSTDSGKQLFLSSALPYADTSMIFGFSGDVEQMVQSGYGVPTSWRGISEWGNIDSYRVEGQSCDRWFMGHCGGGCEYYPSRSTNGRSFNGGASCNDHRRLRSVEIFLAIAW